MAKTDTGHAANVANFSTLISSVEELGSTYNPSADGTTLPALKTKLVEAQNVMAQYSQLRATYADAVDAREALFEPLNKLVTRALNMFKAVSADSAGVATAVSLADKVRGKKKPEAVVQEGESAKKTISTSQQSYNLLTENFRMFIDELAADPNYKPNEAELSVPKLKELYYEMIARNVAVDKAESAFGTGRNNRNKALYAPGSGITDTVDSVKKYIRATVDPSSAHYKAIMSLSFRQSRD